MGASEFTYDLFWSFRSPFSYLLTRRLRALEAEFAVRCNPRPVYPAAVRSPEFFDTRDPLWFSYFTIDMRREAAFHGLPLRWPRPDPVKRDPDGSYPKDQPYIHRLTFLAVAAAERGRGHGGRGRGRRGVRGAPGGVLRGALPVVADHPAAAEARPGQGSGEHRPRAAAPLRGGQYPHRLRQRGRQGSAESLLRETKTRLPGPLTLGNAPSFRISTGKARHDSHL